MSNKLADRPVSERRENLKTAKPDTKRSGDMRKIHALFTARKLEEAVTEGRKFIKNWPTHPFGYKIVGTAYCELKRYSEAKEQFLLALEYNPDDGETYCNLGVALTFLDELDSAKEVLLESQKRAPENAAVFTRLGFVYHKLKQYRLATHCYNRALEIEPKRVDTHHCMGDTLIEMKCKEQAIYHFEQAIEIDPNFVPALVNLAVTIDDLGQSSRAIELYDRALKIAPNSASTISNLGNSLTRAGRFEDAKAAYRRAQSIDPAEHEAFRQLALVKQYKPDDAIVQQMIGHFRDDKTPVFNKIIMGFGLGAVFDQAKEHASAFEFYSTSNELHRKTINVSIPADAARFGRIMEICNKAYFENLDISGSSDAEPVLVIGMPRSGSTLVEQIISSHPHVTGAGEVLFMQEAVDRLSGMTNLPFPDALLKVNAERTHGLATTYTNKLEARAGTSSTWITDKLLYNFIYLGLILRILPKAKIVHVSRNPMDCCLSMFFLKFAVGQIYSYDLRELGQYYRLYQELMQHWQTVLGDRIYNIRYEDVVGDIEGETRKLLDHCGIPFDPACLEFHKSQRSVATASTQQVRQKLYTGAVSRSAPYEPWLGPLKTALETPPVWPVFGNGQTATSKP